MTSTITGMTSGTTGNDRDERDERLAAALRRLVARCRDSAASYRKAAEESRSDILQPEFERLAHERGRLVETLTGIAKDLGVDITKESDRAVDDVHHAFLGFCTKAAPPCPGAWRASDRPCASTLSPPSA